MLCVYSFPLLYSDFSECFSNLIKIHFGMSFISPTDSQLYLPTNLASD